VLEIYTRNSIPNAIAFIDEVRRRLPVAIQRVQTDHGSSAPISPRICATWGLLISTSRPDARRATGR